MPNAFIQNEMSLRILGPTANGVPRIAYLGLFDDSNSANNAYVAITGDASAGTVGSLAFYTNGTNERARIQPDGKVGIGKTSPAATLHVEGTTTIGSFSGVTAVFGTSAQQLYAGVRNSIPFIGAAGDVQLTLWTNNVERLRISSLGYTGVGAGENNAVTQFQVGTKVIDDGTYTYDTNSLMVVHQTPTATATLNDPKETLVLARQGTAAQAYGAAAAFELARYENNGVNARTRLDIKLAHTSFLGGSARVMTLLSNGYVGIGASPAVPLDIVSINNWDNTSTEGDVRIGNATHRLKIGVATSGGGAGDISISAVGGSNKLRLGSGTTSTKQGAIVITDGATVIVQEAWTAPTLGAQWANYTGYGYPAGYMKDSMGFVRLRGLVQRSGTSSNTTIFTLPAGYRPAYTAVIWRGNYGYNVTDAVAWGTATSESVRVDTSGNVFLYTAPAANKTIDICLDGIWFDPRS